jgi:hypothetical protein
MELIMKKIAIITSYTNHIRWDNYGVCDYCMYASQNHNEYANKHNYSYIKEVVDNDSYPGWHPTWIKIDVLRKYLPMFDYVVWIDADAVFKNLEITIESFLDDNVDLVLPKLEFDRVGGQMWTHTTTGFMVWKNSEWSKETLDLLWNDPKNYKIDFFHEQSRLDQILMSKFELSGGENILNKESVDLEKPVKLDNITIIPYSHHKCFNDGDIDYVFHAGGSTPTKLSRLKEVLNQ